jgi:tetratricopeptide (TPR) repeat protein
MTRYDGEAPFSPAILMGISGLCVGALVGYILATAQASPRVYDAPAVQAAALAPAATTAVVNEGELQAYRNILAADPKNAKAATELGNRLYDGGRYAEAVTYYQQALQYDPKNISVSTDLGTALWYMGRADDALAQFERSLAIQPGHPQTLFNMGIVRSEGKQDPTGAIQAWEKLLATNPTYAAAAKVRSLIEDASAKLPRAPIR